MAHLRKLANGHLGKASSGHLGGGFLFNVKDFTITWTGSARLISNGVTYFTAGSQSRTFPGSALSDPAGYKSSNSWLTGANVTALFVGPQNTNFDEIYRNRLHVSFAVGGGSYKTATFQSYMSLHQPTFNIGDIYEFQTPYIMSDRAAEVSFRPYDPDDWDNVTLTNVGITIDSLY